MNSARLRLSSFLSGNRMRGNVLRIVGGGAAGQLLALLASPLLSRLYTPDQFGVLASYVSILTMLIVVVNLRFDFAIVRPETDEEAGRVLWIALGSAVVVSVAALGLSPVVQAQMRTDLPTFLIWLLPLGLLLAGVYQALSFWAVRQGAAGVIGSTRVFQSFTAVGLQVGLGLSPLAPYGLLSGFMAGQVVGLRHLARTVPRSVWKAPSLREVALVFKQYRRFPLLSLPSGLANSAALQLPVLYVATKHGLEVAGFLALAQRVLGSPLDLIGAGVSQAFMGELSKNQTDRQAIKVMFNKLSRTLLMFSVPVLVIGALCPFVFGTLFGSSWRSAGLIAAVLSPMYASRLLGGALAQTMVILDRLKWMFFIDLTRLVLVLGAFFIFLNEMNYMPFLIAYSSIMTSLYLVYYFASRSAISIMSGKILLSERSR